MAALLTASSPYSGRSVALSHDSPLRRDVSSQLRKAKQAVEQKMNSQGGLWVTLYEQLQSVSTAEEEVSGREWETYRVEILREAILPYILDKMLQPRFSLDKARFFQLSQILTALSPTAPSSSSSSGNHPATVLLQLDNIILDIKRERSLFQSELAISLEIASNKQWLPVLSSHRALLHKIGGAAIGLGLLEVVGRPLLMLVPVYTLSQEVIRLAVKLGATEQNGSSGVRLSDLEWSRLNVSDAISIAKLLAMCYAIFQLAAILSLYSGLGYSCLLLGSLSWMLASNDQLLKTYIPALAPHIAHVTRFFDLMFEMEKQIVSTLASSQHQHQQQQQQQQAGSRPIASPPRSARVEELEPDPPVATAVNHHPGDTSIYATATATATATSLSDSGIRQRRPT